ncbi:hypothetical protein Pyrfu_0533 [Pyrolobus fumarii 1A]|uniref:Uncharacterized protein n=1 Tax=Pyrolobus fumarii (strain DSM 11204 / 1A) TaxID=694429 RepID=G0EGN0_PYRF1|nr:hypothetical protein [Pyrolobus fumarii]AEM38404.1 hypothetical protein Pyrfu_0533 [Pyrolobus fumarii 1A]
MPACVDEDVVLAAVAVYSLRRESRILPRSVIEEWLSRVEEEVSPLVRAGRVHEALALLEERLAELARDAPRFLDGSTPAAVKAEVEELWDCIWCRLFAKELGEGRFTEEAAAFFASVASALTIIDRYLRCEIGKGEYVKAAVILVLAGIAARQGVAAQVFEELSNEAYKLFRSMLGNSSVGAHMHTPVGGPGRRASDGWVLARTPS